jgi:Glycosyl transferase family 90
VNKTLRSPLSIAWKVQKFRWRMAFSARAPALPGQANTDELQQLVNQQTAAWKSRPLLTPEQLTQALSELNAHSSSVFIVSIRDQKVRLWEKRQFSFPADEAQFRMAEQQSFLKRAMLYRAFFEAVLCRARASISLDFALDVTDLAQDSTILPIFSFQKRRDAHNPLLPDVDFFHSKWYQNEYDALAYEGKTNTACFVGSSTGDWHTVESIRKLASRRLQMASYFHQHPSVTFLIANATQCLSEEAKTLLMAQPYFSNHVSWEEQLHHRFLIVMDGNGATCSRLVKGLMSNSVVVKFDSPHELYYFSALEPGRDYLLIKTEADLERLLGRAKADPGPFKAIAQQGQDFARKYLTMGSVMDYSALLLEAYAGICRGESSERSIHAEQQGTSALPTFGR